MKLSNFQRGGNKVIFTDLFYKHIMFRQSCGKCHYANTRRPSDITLGDYWGWEKTDPDFNKDNKGVSLILINTTKGQEIFDKIQDRMTVIPARLEDCLQPNLQHPTAIHPRRIDFERDYVRKGFKYVIKKYGKDTFLTRVVRFLKRRLKFKN